MENASILEQLAKDLLEIQMFDIVKAVHTWSDKIIEERKLKQCGSRVMCPWCRQWSEYETGWKFESDKDNPGLNKLTCGCCGGTSHWIFTMGWSYYGPLDPPKPAF